MNINEKRWKEIDNKFTEIQGSIDLDNYLAPRNRRQELEKFKIAVAENRVYNPQFEYDPIPDVNEKGLQRLKAELDPVDPVEKLYLDAITLRLGEISAATDHDPGSITSVTTEAYGSPGDEILKVAQRNLETMNPDQKSYTGDIDGRIYDAEELANICREAMKRYGFDWKVVVVREMGAKAAVDNLIREFWIREDVKFHESLIRMMVVHEIGTHILRSENGYAQPLKIFGRGLPAYQYTEEGLAEFAEEQCGVLHDDTVYRISGRVVGVHAALKGSFFDVYNAVKDYFDPDMAFDIAQRAKLGIADTSKPGSYTKDYTYLEGLHRVRKFFLNASPSQIDAIWAGKVGFQHLDLVAELQKRKYLEVPRVYPEWM